MKLFILTCLFFMGCLSNSYSQSAPCQGQCLINARIDTVSYEYPVYIGKDTSNATSKYITHVLFKGYTTWDKRVSDKHCISPNPADCQIICSVQVMPESTTNILVARNPKKINPADITYQTFITQSYEGIKELRDILCGNQITEKLLSQVAEELYFRGYKVPDENKEMNPELQAALYKFQLDNQLPLGFLNFETLDFLGIAH